MFKTIENNAQGVIIEKKSKFIANIFYVENERQAEETLNEIRKKYYDARHNCFAYRVKTENGIFQKQSDDGEPSGTAGAPMLSILEKRQLVNVIAITTRYFGGILLGTGGLVKAYSEALQVALKNAGEVEKEEGYLVETVLDYSDGAIFEHFCMQNNIKIINKEYAEKVKVIIEISKNKYEKIVEKTLKNYFHNITIKIIEKRNVKST